MAPDGEIIYCEKCTPKLYYRIELIQRAIWGMCVYTGQCELYYMFTHMHYIHVCWMLLHM